jgi:hypothetical protein
MLELIENSVAHFANLWELKLTPKRYLQKFRPFRGLYETALNWITNYYLSKLTRSTHQATAIERQIQLKLSSYIQPFPSPAHTNLGAGALARLAHEELKKIYFILEDHPTWKSKQQIATVIDMLTKTEAKDKVSRYLDSIDLTDTLLIFTDGPAHPKEGLGAAAVKLGWLS